MGRYYSGDIEGKFWFGIQSSTDAEFFGGEGYQPEEMNYWFHKDDTDAIKEGIKDCKKELGKDRKRLDTFFNINNGYNDDMLQKHWVKRYKQSINVKHNLEWYARLLFGEQILKCVQDQGDCSFTAEL